MTEKVKEQIWEIYNYFLDKYEKYVKNDDANSSDFVLLEDAKNDVVSHIKKLEPMSKTYLATDLVPELYQQTILRLLKKTETSFNKDMKATTLLSSFTECFSKSISVTISYQDISDFFYYLKEIALKVLYNNLRDSETDDLICQINKAIVLDAMGGKYMYHDALKELIVTINSKAQLTYSKWGANILRTIAMLNYKAHHYPESIFFFKEYLDKAKCTGNIEKMRINIYIGYCYEKAEKFDEAIALFEDLAKECDSDENIKREFLIEIHHGLGHFYNERAVFGSHQRTQAKVTSDIIMGRDNLRQALSQKIDYISCYGSLFHEYKDYRTALGIFEYAKKQEGIYNNPELNSEMSFYYAQTKMILALNDKQAKNANEEFEKFERHCLETYNHDGIAHARIFKAKLAMGKMKLLPKGARVQKQKKEIEKHIKEVSQYRLSIYASKSIRDEYEKVQNALRIYLHFCQIKFNFEYTEVQHYINQFNDKMKTTIEAQEFSYKTEIEDNSLPLFSVKVNDVQLLGIGDKSIINDYIAELSGKRGSKFEVNSLRSINSLKDLQTYLRSNSRPDVLIVVPSDSTEAVLNSSKIPYCFDQDDIIYILLDTKQYGIAWLKNLYRQESERYNLNDERCCLAQSVEDVLRIAFCFRGLELLKKDLLAPMPLFSLAPTHFSESYNYQLGEVLKIILNQSCDPSGRITSGLLPGAITTQEKKYNDLISAQLNYHVIDIFASHYPCVKEKALFACCFNPNDDIVDESDVKTISFVLMNEDFKRRHNAFQFFDIGKYYSCKALEDYSYDLSKLKDAFIYDNCCETGFCDPPCQVCLSGNVDADTNIATNSNLVCRLLKYIIGEEISEFRYEYKIIKKDATSDSNIFLFLLSDMENLLKNDRPVAASVSETEVTEIKGETSPLLPIDDTRSLEEDTENYNPAIPSVRKDSKGEKDVSSKKIFVTYCWTPEAHQKKVFKFVDDLRRNGFDAEQDFDIMQRENNLQKMMTIGFSYDKVVVVLSEEYKKRADTLIGGVGQEAPMIAAQKKKEPNKFIFVSLDSISLGIIDKICPVLFAGENIIDVTSTDDMNGTNLLFSKLMDEPLIDRNPVASAFPAIKKVHKAQGE